MEKFILICCLIAQWLNESVQQETEMTKEMFQKLEQENKQLLAIVAQLQDQVNNTKKDTMEMMETLKVNENEVRDQELQQIKQQLAQLQQIVLNGGQQSQVPDETIHLDVKNAGVPINVRATTPLQTMAKTTVLDGRTYLFITKQTANWFEAYAYCNLMGMTLLNIETEAENTLIMTQLEKLGMTKEWVMTGGNKIGWQNYGWLTAVPVDFEDWARGQPDKFSTEHCIILWRGDWYDLPCDSVRIRFICEQVD